MNTDKPWRPGNVRSGMWSGDMAAVFANEKKERLEWASFVNNYKKAAHKSGEHLYCVYCVRG